jgi:hypothetical protein
MPPRDHPHIGEPTPLPHARTALALCLAHMRGDEDGQVELVRSLTMVELQLALITAVECIAGLVGAERGMRPEDVLRAAIEMNVAMEAGS